MFDMKYHILHNFKTSTSIKGKKDFPKLKLLKDFDFNLTSSPGGILN